jgi:hypothetical protein
MKRSFTVGSYLLKDALSHSATPKTSKFSSSFLSISAIGPKLCFGLLFSCLSLTGCVSETVTQPVPKDTKIGVVSLLGPSQFVLDENSAPTKAISPSSQIAFAHELSAEPTDQKVAENIVSALHHKGYTNVAMINVPAGANPVQTLKNQKDLAMILVVSPDAGHAPQTKVGSIHDDQLIGYGAYFQDNPKEQHTYAYLNYDISVYNAKNMQLISTASYNQKKELPFTHFASNFHDLPHTTVASLQKWMNNSAAPMIQAEALRTLDHSFG